MSKALSRVRALVSDIDQIQNQGRKSSYIPPNPVIAAGVQAMPSFQATAEKTATPIRPAVDQGKVLIQLTGNIAIQLQLDHTDELVEVRQLGESIEIRFVDGKVIHLPLKGVA